MKYSVVIPTLTKTKEHLDIFQECVQSVEDNSSDYELIVVDDGSFFDMSDYVTPTTLVIHQDNQGIAKSWNDGLNLARGEYITIINDDITVEKGWLDKLRQALELDEDYWVAAPGVAGKTNGEGIEENDQWFPGYCFMVHKSIKSEQYAVGLFDEQFSPFNFEDTDYWTRVLQAGGKLVRNYSTTITHKEGHVLHTLDYDNVSNENKAKFIAKHGFDPIPVFYEGAQYDFSSNP